MTFSSEKIRAFSVGDRVNLVSSKTRGDVTHHVETSFPKDDAPSVALAILEAAGIKAARDEQAQSNPERWASKAAEALTYSVKHRAEIAEREAEDAKVAEYRRVVLEAEGAWPESISAWALMGDSKRAIWRNRYRAARKFFEEA